MGLHFVMMNNRSPALPSLMRYLLTWFVGCAIAMVFAYTELLDYYLSLGVELRTQSLLEKTALQYSASEKEGSKLPRDQNLRSYDALSKIPPEILSKFSPHNFSHGDVQRFVNVDFEDSPDSPDSKRFRTETFDLCGQQVCDLLFLYPYQLKGARWLYLLHGVVGSDEDYEQLELTEHVAFAIGALFAMLLIIISIFIVRSLVAPLRKLESWSDVQSFDVKVEVPNLRFKEYDTLANRLQNAFQSVRDATSREKLFLRHASHELRTPIAILSSNLELLDRLTKHPDRTEAETKALLRQYRAIEDIQLLIETLLWVNRKSTQTPNSETVGLKHEVTEIVESYRYLIESDQVDLYLREGDAVVSAPASAVRIVLSNLIKNAFQHTKAGEISITITADKVLIQNISTAAPAREANDQYGFGLGLELVGLICDRLEWRCFYEDIAGGRRTILEFSP